MRKHALLALTLLLLAGCGEKPQTLSASQQPGFRTDAWHQQLRERTESQSEAERIYRSG
jgi:hypothetical protein